MVDRFLRASPAVVEGIGPATETALAGAGIHTIADLLRKGPDYVHRALPATSLQRAERWCGAALLLQVDGVSPDLAEAFTAVGIASPSDLADAGLQTLERAVKAAQDSRRLAARPSIYALAELQRKAARLRATGLLAGRLVDAQSGAGLPNLEVRAAARVTTTDEQGTFDLVGLPAGQNRVSIRRGERLVSFEVTIAPNTVSPATTIRLQPLPATPLPARTIRESDGGLLSVEGRHDCQADAPRTDDLAR